MAILASVEMEYSLAICLYDRPREKTFVAILP